MPNLLNLLSDYAPSVRALGIFGFTTVCLWLTLAALVSRSHQHSANYRTKPLEDWNSNV